jgi:hypothetical protein
MSKGNDASDAENWLEGWKRLGLCAPPTLLHPIRGDVCDRCGTNGFGRGCWSVHKSTTVHLTVKKERTKHTTLSKI